MSAGLPVIADIAPCGWYGRKLAELTFPLSALRRARGDDVDQLKRHHYFAGLSDYVDDEVTPPRSGFDIRGNGFEHGHAH
jgi:hypothetical protein